MVAEQFLRHLILWLKNFRPTFYETVSFDGLKKVQNLVTPVKTGVQKYLKKSAAADFRGNDKKEHIAAFYETINLFLHSTFKPVVLSRNRSTEFI